MAAWTGEYWQERDLHLVPDPRLLPGWSKGLYKSTRAETFNQASLYIAITLTLHTLILTFTSVIQEAS